MKRFKVWSTITGEFISKSISIEELVMQSPTNFSLKGVKEDFTFLSYMGFFSKDGEEFCEGDIVGRKDLDVNSESYHRWADGEDEAFDEIPVVWVDIDIVVTDRLPVFWLKGETFGYEGEELASPSCYEILGNIFENPELFDKYKLN